MAPQKRPIRFYFLWSGIFLMSALVLLQFLPVNRTNPPVTADLKAPENVKAVLRRACYDCHSFETRWPWYAQVRPMAFVVNRHVTEGREKLNFSTWESHTPEWRARKAKVAVDEMEDGSMPPSYYISMHRDAVLSPDDMILLQSWAKTVPAK